MKKCPLCGANCFDDMHTCYCCMHRFCETDTDGGIHKSDSHENPLMGESEAPDGGGGASSAEASAEAEEERMPPVLAFGPTIERLSDVGECVRIDVPLRGLIAMIAAARAAACQDAPVDLPPAA